MPDVQSNDQQQPDAQQPQQSETPATWDSWLGGLPEDQRTTVSKLYEAQTQGLRSALDKERSSRTQLEKDLRETAAKAEKGSDAEKRLTEMADKLADANRAIDFFKEAAKPEIGVADVEAAWIIASAKPEEFFDKRGNVNFKLLKERHPALFRQASIPRVGAGNGAGQGGEGKQDMNNFIRRAAGRG